MGWSEEVKSGMYWCHICDILVKEERVKWLKGWQKRAKRVAKEGRKVGKRRQKRAVKESMVRV